MESESQKQLYRATFNASLLTWLKDLKWPGRWDLLTNGRRALGSVSEQNHRGAEGSIREHKGAQGSTGEQNHRGTLHWVHKGLQESTVLGAEGTTGELKNRGALYWVHKEPQGSRRECQVQLGPEVSIRNHEVVPPRSIAMQCIGDTGKYLCELGCIWENWGEPGSTE